MVSRSRFIRRFQVRVCWRKQVMSPMRRLPKHCRESKLTSISAWFSQLPCLGGMCCNLHGRCAGDVKESRNDSSIQWRQTEPGLILCAVRWYLRYSLSLRDVEELLEERGLNVDHTTVWRWVQYYGPELEQRLRKHLKPTNRSWRVDETYGTPSQRSPP